MGMKVFLTTPVSKDNTHGRWVLLPIRQERIGGILQRMNYATEQPEFFVSDETADIVILRGTVSSYSEAVRLNNLARDISSLSEHDENIFCALMECESQPDISTAEQMLKQLSKWELLDGIDTDETLGKFFADVWSKKVPYSDNSSIGIYIRNRYKCVFTSFGCLICGLE